VEDPRAGTMGGSGRWGWEAGSGKKKLSLHLIPTLCVTLGRMRPLPPCLSLLWHHALIMVFRVNAGGLKQGVQ